MNTNENFSTPAEMTDAFRDFILENAGEFVTLLFDPALSANEQLERLKDLYSKGGWHLDIKGTGGVFKHLESFDDPEFLLLAIRRSAVPFVIKDCKKTNLWRVLAMWGKAKKAFKALRVSNSQNYSKK